VTLALVVAVSAALVLAMVAAWMVQRRTGNAGWVDMVWSFALGAAGLVYALSLAPGIVWPGPRQVLVGVLIAFWSLRLGLYLAERTRRGPEDSRYAQFRRDWGAKFQQRMFWFLQAQAAAAILLALSVLIAARNPAPLGLGDLAGVAVLAAAIAGEALADAQLRRFRRECGAAGGICERGLWRWSRHPNYFFEWLGWLAYPLFAVDFRGDYPWGWLAFLAPALIYYLLVHVSGIPPLEQQMLRTRGDAYRAYQARTRAFLPLPLARSA
jgi:steroid 5-alpha reductase family enzyme